jgi:cation transport ATPase
MRDKFSLGVEPNQMMRSAMISSRSRRLETPEATTAGLPARQSANASFADQRQEEQEHNDPATQMLAKLSIGWGLMAVCVVIHAGGVTSAVRWVRRQQIRQQLWPWTWLFIRLAAWIVLLHFLEITAWALVYAWRGAIPGMQAAWYFSAVTYTTTGYGDLVLPQEWRLVGAIEALTGILMCGWSTGFFFAVVSRMYREPTSVDAPL